MPRLPKMRTGTQLKANRRSVPFSLWPVATANAPRPPVQSLLFATDPWVIMKHAIAEQIQNPVTAREALSYIDQASDFYRSALQSMIDAAKPVQLYYSYLNVAKAFILCRGRQQSLPNIRHGISETIAQGGQEFTDAYMSVGTPRGTSHAYKRLRSFSRHWVIRHFRIDTRFRSPDLFLKYYLDIDYGRARC